MESCLTMGIHTITEDESPRPGLHARRRISIVLPVHNEEDCLEALYSELYRRIGLEKE